MPKIRKQLYRKAREMAAVSVEMASEEAVAGSSGNSHQIEYASSIPTTLDVSDSTDDSPYVVNDMLESSDDDFFFNDPSVNEPARSSKVASNIFSWKTELREWALKHKITISALSDLLHVMKRGDIADLPLDGRTLLKTPKQITTKVVAPGHYYHFGLLYCVERLLFNYKFSCNLESVEICVNIDGLPISKSTTSQFYPILCTLFQNRNHVEVIGIYHGNGKPDNANLFLKEFVDDAVSLTSDGVSYNGHVYNFKIKAFIFDVPAKAFCTYTNGHTGYKSCSKCNIHGVYRNNRVCFPPEHNTKLRTHEEFIAKSDSPHHLGTSVLELIPNIDMIRDIPLDYMHLVCLGVMRKLLFLWCGAAKPPSKLSSRDTKKLSCMLVRNSNNTPIEFARKPRSLDEVRRWKATEYRQFLLYTGPVLSKSILNADMYLNFITLHVAITILSSKKYSEMYLGYAQSLLEYFVESFISLYGKQHVSHNIHNLLHLASDVEKFGPVDNFSSFPFENQLYGIKSLLRNSYKPLEQIINRITEQTRHAPGAPLSHTSIIACKEHQDGPLLPGSRSPQYQQLVCENYSIKLSTGNSCCGLKDGAVIAVENIATTNDSHLVIIGRKYNDLKDLYEAPCPSSTFKIYLCSNLSELQMWSINEISLKYFVVNTSGNQVAVIPILHSEINH
uniref:Transposase domain-containing protein n=1 Tax=Photinus pyralis TaxID=7054 RepID=A0A1Y1K5S2_PHOPY